jgi:hypothetical protein
MQVTKTPRVPSFGQLTWRARCGQQHSTVCRLQLQACGHSLTQYTAHNTQHRHTPLVIQVWLQGVETYKPGAWDGQGIQMQPALNTLFSCGCFSG